MIWASRNRTSFSLICGQKVRFDSKILPENISPENKSLHKPLNVGRTNIKFLSSKFKTIHHFYPNKYEDRTALFSRFEENRIRYRSRKLIEAPKKPGY